MVSVRNRVVALLLGFVLAAFLGEVAARLAFPSDENGDVYAQGQRLVPFHLPIASTRRLVASLDHGALGKCVYDAECGWSPLPGAQDGDGGYYDAAGIRTAMPDEQYERDPEPGTLRIALFGDSYTHGTEVSKIG